MGVLAAVGCIWPFCEVEDPAAAASAAAFSMAMVSLFGLLPRTPLRTGRGGRGCGRRYGDCMERRDLLDWHNVGIRVLGKVTNRQLSVISALCTSESGVCVSLRQMFILNAE